MLTLLLAYPTYLLGVPSLGRENLPASEMGCTTSDRKSAPKLGLLHVFLFSSSHAWCITRAQHKMCSAFGCACGTKAQAEGWIHKGLSGLEGMVTFLSPKGRFLTPPCNCQLRLVSIQTGSVFPEPRFPIKSRLCTKDPLQIPQGENPWEETAAKVSSWWRWM